MKIVGTTGFNKKTLWDLNKITLKNHREYCKFNGYQINWRFISHNHIDNSWRHPEVIIDTMSNKKFNTYDVVVNTGDKNIVTNFNIGVESKMMLHFNPTKHKMVLQYWMLDPDFMPLIPYSDEPNGKIKFKKITEPYLIIAAE